MGEGWWWAHLHVPLQHSMRSRLQLSIARQAIVNAGHSGVTARLAPRHKNYCTDANLGVTFEAKQAMVSVWLKPSATSSLSKTVRLTAVIQDRNSLQKRLFESVERLDISHRAQCPDRFRPEVAQLKDIRAALDQPGKTGGASEATSRRSRPRRGHRDWPTPPKI